MLPLDHSGDKKMWRSTIFPLGELIGWAIESLNSTDINFVLKVEKILLKVSKDI